jgi:hypothetical protein
VDIIDAEKFITPLLNQTLTINAISSIVGNNLAEHIQKHVTDNIGNSFPVDKARQLLESTRKFSGNNLNIIKAQVILTLILDKGIKPPFTPEQKQALNDMYEAKTNLSLTDEERKRIYENAAKQFGLTDADFAEIDTQIGFKIDSMSPEEKKTNEQLIKDTEEMAKKDQRVYESLGWNKAAAAAGALADTCRNVINSLNTNQRNADTAAPDGQKIANSQVLSSTAPPPSADTFTAAIERLLKAANAEEAKAELANVRAELHKLDERIEENNKNANKLFAQELDKAAQEKLESELVEQKAAVQILFELCDLAESLYSAEGVENTDTLRQTLSALAELVQWIAPRLENEIKTSAELLQRTFAGADKAASAPTDDLRNFYKEQISRQINEQIENKYQVNLELKQTEAQARLFDIFVDLAFTPVVSEKFLPDLQAVSTFIQKARTLAETIRLDKIFQNIANENTQAAVEEFRLELEKISALPGLQIVMGWKTLLEVREAEWELAAGEINPLKAGRKLTEAREKLAANNLPGMLTVWESLDEQEKQYQKTFIKEKLEGGLSVNELAEILNLNSEALPLELRALVKTALENKIEKLRDTSALQELPVEKLKALLSILSGNGLSAAYDIVQDAIDKKEKTTNPQPEPVTA